MALKHQQMPKAILPRGFGEVFQEQLLGAPSQTLSASWLLIEQPLLTSVESELKGGSRTNKNQGRESFHPFSSSLALPVAT
jgi:hypothetical protein|tara:strand:+ start:613 stop:855 length:243 start_codon:yes stop_codon:yes gene_type:complete